jgi:hypothetical protein
VPLGAAFRTHGSSEEDVELDEKKSFEERLREVLRQTVSKSGVTKGKKLGYLNALAKLWSLRESTKPNDLSLREVLLW